MDFRHVLTLFLVTALTLCGCSPTEETKTEPESLTSQTEAIGHEAARMIKTPMEKAGTTADQENMRLQKLEERLNRNE